MMAPDRRALVRHALLLLMDIFDGDLDKTDILTDILIRPLYDLDHQGLATEFN